MKPILLVDLDDTLLTNDIEHFLPAYLGALDDYLHPRTGKTHISKHVLQATVMMVNNKQPDRTLEQVFDEHFYPALGISKVDISSNISGFYENEFPKLRSLTASRDAAIQFINTCVDREYGLVIATNPLFPRSAILQRLEWADLALRDVPYRIITTFENFHFSKPHAAYYAEIYVQLGMPQNPIAMIGNSLDHDCLPAAHIGIPSFLLGNPLPAPMAMIDTGGMEDILPWIGQVQQTPVRFPEFNSAENIRTWLAAISAAVDTWMNRQADAIKCGHNHKIIQEALFPLFAKAGEINSQINGNSRPTTDLTRCQIDLWTTLGQKASQDAPNGAVQNSTLPYDIIQVVRELLENEEQIIREIYDRIEK